MMDVSRSEVVMIVGEAVVLGDKKVELRTTTFEGFNLEAQLGVPPEAAASGN